MKGLFQNMADVLDKFMYLLGMKALIKQFFTSLFLVNQGTVS